jgi:hypothetical protein
MNRFVSATLAGLVLGCLVSPANAQYGYPAANYPQPYAPSAPMPMGYMPMNNGGTMPQVMPAAAMPSQPVMMVPVYVTRIVPMLGPLETMPQGGPLDANALAPNQAPIVNAAQVAHPVPAAAAQATTLPATPTASTLGDTGLQQTAAKQTESPASKPWYKKTWDWVSHPFQK